jgi:osmotically-inducible protein OsmY
MLILPGCVPVVAGAAVGATGGAVLYDRRPMKVMAQDDNIAYAIEKKLFHIDEIRTQCHVGITLYGGVVLLVGQAPTQVLKDQVTTVAKTVPGIKRLYNQITIGAPTSYLTRTSDSWITTKVKTQLIMAKNLKSGQFKVLTENGTVFLMGIVSRSQAQIAVDIARRVSGVQKVVKVFEYRRGDDIGNNVQKSQPAASSSTSSSRATNINTAKIQPRTTTMAQTDEALYRQDGA